MFFSKIHFLFSFLLGKHNARDATLITTCLSLFSKAFGYARTLLVAYLFGATAFVDAYYVAFGAVTFIGGMLHNAIEATLIPNMVQSDEKSAHDLFSTIFIALMVFVLFIILILFYFPMQYIKIFASTFDLERIEYAANMVRWLLPILIGQVAIALFSAWANYKNRFALPSTIMAFANISVILILLALYPIMGDYALSAFQSVGYVLLALLMYWVSSDAPLRPKKSLPRSVIRKVSYEAALRIATTGAFFLYTLIDRYFASSLTIGNVAAISYANLIFIQPTGLTGNAFSIYFVRANETVKSPKESKELLSIALFVAFSYFLPAAILLSILSKTIVIVLLGHGAFDANAVNMTYPCLAILTLGLPIYIWNMIIDKHAMAIGRLRTLLLWGYIGVLGNFFLDSLFVEPFGAPGLCAATVIMWYISTICKMLFFCRDILWRICKTLIPQVVIVAIWAIPLYFATLGRIYAPLLGGIAIISLHYLLCDKLGIFNRIPKGWRPVAVISVFAQRIRLFF